MNLSRIATCIGILCIASCAHHKHEPAPDASSGQSRLLWSWDEKADNKHSKDPVHIRVVLDEQKAHILRGDREIGWTYVATGITKFPTPIGTYTILERSSDKHSNLYGKIYDAEGKVIESDAKMGRDPVPEGGRFEGAQMAFWMRLTHDGLGMHVGPIPHPGRRASHGCVRLPREAAQKIFHTVRRGTEVVIVQSAKDPKPPVRLVAPDAPKPAASKPAVSTATKPTSKLPASAAPAAPIAPGLPPLNDKPPSLTVPAPTAKPSGS